MKDQKLRRLDVMVQLVKKENQRQLKKWGAQDRSPFEWLCFMGEEVGEVNKAIAEHHYREGPAMDIVEEAIHVSTLALKLAEMYWVKDTPLEEFL